MGSPDGRFALVIGAMAKSQDVAATVVDLLARPCDRVLLAFGLVSKASWG